MFTSTARNPRRGSRRTATPPAVLSAPLQSWNMSLFAHLVSPETASNAITGRAHPVRPDTCLRAPRRRETRLILHVEGLVVHADVVGADVKQMCDRVV